MTKFLWHNLDVLRAQIRPVNRWPFKRSDLRKKKANGFKNIPEIWIQNIKELTELYGSRASIVSSGHFMLAEGCAGAFWPQCREIVLLNDVGEEDNPWSPERFLALFFHELAHAIQYRVIQNLEFADKNRDPFEVYFRFKDHSI